MNKKFLIGTFTLNTCPNITEIISKNLDYVIIDREHGTHSFINTNILNKIIKKNCLSLIRASHLSKIEIQRCLDLNPDGILIPQISSYEDAKLAVSSSYFKPIGDRGLSPYTSAFDYNHNDSDSKKKKINKKIFVGLLIEGVTGLAALDKICNDFFKEISLIYFGLYDFTSSLNLKPNWQDPRVQKAVKKIIQICNKKKIRVGSIARNLQEIKFLKKIGINFICYQNDTGIIHEAFNHIKKIK
jgi:2-keto-3-deoxy-L-rhamnonate aldolase RhmA